MLRKNRIVYTFVNCVILYSYCGLATTSVQPAEPFLDVSTNTPTDGDTVTFKCNDSQAQSVQSYTGHTVTYQFLRDGRPLTTNLNVPEFTINASITAGQNGNYSCTVFVDAVASNISDPSTIAVLPKTPSLVVSATEATFTNTTNITLTCHTESPAGSGSLPQYMFYLNGTQLPPPGANESSILLDVDNLDILGQYTCRAIIGGVESRDSVGWAVGRLLKEGADQGTTQATTLVLSLAECLRECTRRPNCTAAVSEDVTHCSFITSPIAGSGASLNQGQKTKIFQLLDTANKTQAVTANCSTFIEVTPGHPVKLGNPDVILQPCEISAVAADDNATIKVTFEPFYKICTNNKTTVSEVIQSVTSELLSLPNSTIITLSPSQDSRLNMSSPFCAEPIIFESPPSTGYITWNIQKLYDYTVTLEASPPVVTVAPNISSPTSSDVATSTTIGPAPTLSPSSTAAAVTMTTSYPGNSTATNSKTNQNETFSKAMASGDDGVNVGAVAGGVVGGLALLALVGGVVWYKFIRSASKVIPVKPTELTPPTSARASPSPQSPPSPPSPQGQVAETNVAEDVP